MGTKTQTVKRNGALYQVRLVPCGKADRCKNCQSTGGHLSVYVDTGLPGGARWSYVGSRLPDADPDYQAPVCQREGCTNPTPRNGQKYCSARCRVAVNRAK
jgi:hypothetical protein